MRSCIALTLSLSGGLAFSAPLPNDACIKDERCKEHHDKAVNYYNQQYFEEALSEFQAAYSARQMPLLLINIGRTLHRLGRLDEAITFYNRYEQASPNDDPETTKKVREYKAQAEVLLSAKGAAATTAPPPPTPDPAPAGFFRCFRGLCVLGC